MDNPLVNTLLSLKYKIPEIAKHIGIFKRTKSSRIKNKHFGALFFKAIKGKKVIPIDKAVIIDMDTYNHIKSMLISSHSTK